MRENEILLAEIRRDEGVRRRPYRDTVGKLTIGVGRNLDDLGLSDDEIDHLLINDISRSVADLDRALPWWRTLSPARRRVMVNMAFNLGITKLLGFTNTLRAIRRGDYAAAARGMLASKWAGQVGARARRLAEMMRNG